VISLPSYPPTEARVRLLQAINPDFRGYPAWRAIITTPILSNIWRSGNRDLIIFDLTSQQQEDALLAVIDSLNRQASESSQSNLVTVSLHVKQSHLDSVAEVSRWASSLAEKTS